MSLKANLILLFIAGLLLTALATRNGSVAILTLPFLFYLSAGLLRMPKQALVQASRQLSTTRCESGNPVTQTLIIHNDGLNIPCLEINEQVPPGVSVLSGGLIKRVALPAGERFELKYTFSAPRGRFDWQSISVVTSDPLGLFEHHYETPAPAQVLVLPQPLPLRRLPVRLSHTLRTVGPNLSRLPGSGVDFWGVREYHPGDSLRWIYWRNAARYPQQLFTKQFEREEMANIGLLLDARSSNGQIQDNLLEYSIQATAGLAKALLQMGNRVSLLIWSERMVRVFPGTGKHQLVQILDRLAECESGGKLSLDTLKYLPVRLFPTNSMIILISPLRADDIPSLVRLKAERYQVMLVSPDPLGLTYPDEQGDPYLQLAARAARIERKALIWQIRQMGIEAVNWPVEEPLFRQAWPESHVRRAANLL